MKNQTETLGKRHSDKLARISPKDCPLREAFNLVGRALVRDWIGVEFGKEDDSDWVRKGTKIYGKIWEANARDRLAPDEVAARIGDLPQIKRKVRDLKKLVTEEPNNATEQNRHDFMGWATFCEELKDYKKDPDYYKAEFQLWELGEQARKFLNEMGCSGHVESWIEDHDANQHPVPAAHWRKPDSGFWWSPLNGFAGYRSSQGFSPNDWSGDLWFDRAALNTYLQSLTSGEASDESGFTLDARSKGGQQPKQKQGLQEAMSCIVKMLIEDEISPSASAVWTWLCENALQEDPHDFDPFILDCALLYVDGDTLIFQNSVGRPAHITRRSLDTYIRQAISAAHNHP